MNQSIQWNVSQGFNVAVTTICSPAGFLGDVVSIRTLKGPAESDGKFQFFFAFNASRKEVRKVRFLLIFLLKQHVECGCFEINLLA